MRRMRNLRPSERGQNMVEIMLVLPILLVVFFGMIEVGWWVHSYVTVATAAREGARYGSRGLHLPADEIADVTKVAMAGTINVDLVGSDANTTIIVTEVDVDPDGTYDIFETYTLGDLPVSSAICLVDPCASDSINLKIVRDENVTFNGDPILCTEDPAIGCRNDLVIVEIFHRHNLVLGTVFVTDFLPDVIPVDARGVMRVMMERAPW